MTDDLLKDGPRNPDPHGGVDDPGDPVPEVKDPPASGILQDGVSIQDPNFV